MGTERFTRRTILTTTAAAATAIAAPFVRRAYAAGKVDPVGRMTLAWHTNIAPRWLDPLQHDGSATPDNFLMVVQDALIKNYKTQLYDHLALAERLDFAEDASSATFRLRDGVKFHDGSPVTPEDVKWSYEHYHGAWAQVLHDETDQIKILDKRTVQFDFKRPFLDFPRLIGTSNVCGAGWVVPANYYEKVGKDGFVAKPIGAGPYKLVAQQPGIRLDFEAFDRYYRPVHVKQLTMMAVPEAATRIAMLERGEADIIYFVPGELIARVKNNPKLTLAPVVSGNWWLEFPGFRDPKNPFHDVRVRQAISLAIDREAMNQAECDGKGVVDGNWINNDVEYGMEWPKWPRDVAKAKQLMAEAGYPNGFHVDWLTATPNYYSRGERIVSQLQAIGIRTKNQIMERGVFLKKMESGLSQWPGVQIILNVTRIGGTWSNWYEAFFKCGGFQSKDFFCVKELDDKFTSYLASHDVAERKKLAYEIQTTMLENYYVVPVFRHAFVNAYGPRIKAAKWQDVFPTITTGYAYPWEDIELKA